MKKNAIMELQRLERAESTIKTGVSPFLFFSLPKPYMAKTHTQPVHTILALSVIGVASSFVFVLSALASGMVPSEVITLANHARTEAGLPALTENSILATAAKNKADDMIKHDYFAHTSPAGVAPWYWIKDAGYRYQAAGENLAINYTDARDQHDAWMKSETHRANIMNTRYQEIGVAVVKGKINGKESIITVEYFGTPLVAAVKEPAPVPMAPEVAPAEIKGTETVLETPSQIITPVVPPSPTTVSPLVQSEEDRILTLLSLLSVLLMMLLAPAMILLRALQFLLEAKREGTVSVPMLPSIHIDGIHKAAH